MLKTRTATDADMPFLLVTFCKSVRGDARHTNGVSTAALRMLFPQSWHKMVCYHEDEPSVVLGWLIYRDEGTVAWCYVRPEARGRGIMTLLLHDAGIRIHRPILSPFRPRGPIRLRILHRPWITLEPDHLH